MIQRIYVSRRWILACLVLFVFAGMSGCGGTENPLGPRPQGHLVIVGGGLKDDHAAVFNRFVSLCGDGPIGIVPIASGDGLKAGESNIERWRKYSGTRGVVVIPLTQNDAAKADDPAIAAQIRSCGGLWFTGGQQDRVVTVLRPGGKRSACLDACFAVLEQKNGVIGGTSAGAAIMSDPMITGGRSLSAKSRDPDNEDGRRVTTGPGLGFFRFGLTDQHFVQRGRQGRLIDALHDTQIPRGYGVSENCALVVDRASGSCEVLGTEHAAWIIDTSGPDAFGPARQTVRVCVLSNGDRADATAGRGIPAADARDQRAHGSAAVTRACDDVWASANIRFALSTLAQTQDSKVILRDPVTTLTFRADQASRVAQRPGEAFSRFADIRLTIERTGSALVR